MKIKAEDFPLYQLLLAQKIPCEKLQQSFEVANAKNESSDYAAYCFALGMQMIANTPGFVTGQTEEMTQKTLRSCQAVLEDGEKKSAVARAILKGANRKQSPLQPR